MLAFALTAALAKSGDIEVAVAHLEASASQGLPTSLVPTAHPLPNHVVGEAKALTTRFPNAASAWLVRGRCEMRATDFAAAEASFRRAAALGDRRGLPLTQRAIRYASVARRIEPWGVLDQLLDQGGGYWIAACTKGSEGDRTLVEVGPSGSPRVLAKMTLDGANFTEFNFGFRDLDGDRRPELIAESGCWLSGGGVCEVSIFKGERGRWRRVYRQVGTLWNVPLVDLDRDGVCELAIRDWVWYHGPVWTRIYRFEGGRLRETTRRHRTFLRRQVQELREDFRAWNVLPDRRKERKEDVEAVLREYGYRL
ncbi:MAG: hypothetical protein ACO1SV_19080 [Fimbriimonas sp.]